MTDSRSRSSRRPVAGALGLLLLAAVLFILATMLSLADTGDETNWYAWTALVLCAVAATGGIVLLIRRRS